MTPSWIESSPSRSGSRRSKRIGLSGLLCLLAGCAVGVSGDRKSGSPSDTLAAFTYYEEGTQVALTVGVRPALSRRERAYIPLEISALNKDLPSLTFTPESFTLVDSHGNSFPVVGHDELVKGYGSTDIDRRLGEIESIVQRKYRSFERVPSNFTPGFDDSIPRTRVMLPRFGYFVDMIYFPNPSPPTPPGPYDLLVRVPELPDVLVVRFYVGAPR